MMSVTDLQTLSADELWQLHELVKATLFERLQSERDRLTQRLQTLERGKHLLGSRGLRSRKARTVDTGVVVPFASVT